MSDTPNTPARRVQPGTLAPIEDIAPAVPDTSAVKDFALFKIGDGDVLSLMAENLGATGIDFGTLTGLVWPSGSNAVFNLDTAEGPKAMKELVCVVLRFRDGRVLWGGPIGDSNGEPPVCVSEDMIAGVGQPGGECKGCPFNEWGTAIKDDGSKGRGKRCSERRRLFVMVPGSLLPIHLNIPPTSLKPIRQYFAKLIGLGLPYYAVVTKIRLSKSKSKDGVEYAEAEFEMVGRLSADELQVFRTLNEQFAAAFEATSVTDLAQKERDTTTEPAQPGDDVTPPVDPDEEPQRSDAADDTPV